MKHAADPDALALEVKQRDLFSEARLQVAALHNLAGAADRGSGSTVYLTAREAIMSAIHAVMQHIFTLPELPLH